MKGKGDYCDDDVEGFLKRVFVCAMKALPGDDYSGMRWQYPGSAMMRLTLKVPLICIQISGKNERNSDLTGGLIMIMQWHWRTSKAPGVTK